MCGIFGIISKDDGKTMKGAHRDAFEQLLHIDDLRGDDSHGIYAVDKRRNVFWAKEAKTSVKTFLDHQKVKYITQGISFDNRVTVGHNRKATKGLVTDENAHPFVEGDTILVHNGTLTDHHKLANTTVDSHAIAVAIEKEGIKETIARIHGAFALAFYKANEDTFYLVRNDERPLTIFETDGGWCFASEAWMMYGALTRNSLAADKLVVLKPYELHSFKFSDKTVEHTVEQLPIPEKPPVVPVNFTAGKASRKAAKAQKAKGGQKASQHSNRHPILHYSKGDIVTFSPKSLGLQPNGDWHLTGQHPRHKEIQCVLRCSKAEGYQNAQFWWNQSSVTAVVESVFSTDLATGKGRLYLSDPGIAVDVTTSNGVSLSEEDIENIKECCRCHTPFEEYEDYQDGFAQIAMNGKPRVFCSTCVDELREKNPKWGT